MAPSYRPVIPLVGGPYKEGKDYGKTLVESFVLKMEGLSSQTLGTLSSNTPVICATIQSNRAFAVSIMGALGSDVVVRSISL